jgi:hypothetical protein
VTQALNELGVPKMMQVAGLKPIGAGALAIAAGVLVVGGT